MDKDKPKMTIEGYHSEDVKETMYNIIKPFDELIESDKNYKGSDIKLIFSRMREFVEYCFLI